jgi:hypothetical protein
MQEVDHIESGDHGIGQFNKRLRERLSVHPAHLFRNTRKLSGPCTECGAPGGACAFSRREVPGYVQIRVRPHAARHDIAGQIAPAAGDEHTHEPAAGQRLPRSRRPASRSPCRWPDRSPLRAWPAPRADRQGQFPPPGRRPPSAATSPRPWQACQQPSAPIVSCPAALPVSRRRAHTLRLLSARSWYSPARSHLRLHAFARDDTQLIMAISRSPDPRSAWTAGYS